MTPAGFLCWCSIITFGNLANYPNRLVAAFRDNSGGLTAQPVVNRVQSVVAGFIYVIQIWVRNKPTAEPAHYDFSAVFAKSFQSNHPFLF